MACCDDCNSGCTDCGGNCGEAKVIITKQGLNGTNGTNGTAVLFSNYSPEFSATGTFASTVVPSMGYTVAALELKNNGDAVEVKAMTVKTVQAGTFAARFFFNGVQFSNLNSLIGGAGAVPIVFNGCIRRTSNTAVAIEGVLNYYDGTVVAAKVTGVPPLSSVYFFDYVTGLDLTANSYDLTMEIQGDSLTAPIETRYFTVEKKVAI